MALVTYKPQEVPRTMYLPVQFRWNPDPGLSLPFGIIDGVPFNRNDPMVWRRGRAQQILSKIYWKLLVEDVFSAFRHTNLAAKAFHKNKVQVNSFKALESNWAANKLRPGGNVAQEYAEHFEHLAKASCAHKES